MPYDPHKHHRHSLRLPDYDYTQAGAYFITICTQRRSSWFGHVQDGQMQHNPAGAAIWQLWLNLPQSFPQITLDTAVLMPDHLHGILWITSASTTHTRMERPTGTVVGSLGRCVQAFKSLSTSAYIRGVQAAGWEPFPGRLWQRNYYERIVRQDELNAVRDYIATNPRRWRIPR